MHLLNASLIASMIKVFLTISLVGHRISQTTTVRLEWLKRDLTKVPLSTPIGTFQHVPFFSGGLSMSPYEADGPGRTLENEKGTTQFSHVVSNALEVLAMLKGHNFPLALAGHYHYEQKFALQGLNTRFEQTGAVIAPSSIGPITMPSGYFIYCHKW